MSSSQFMRYDGQPTKWLTFHEVDLSEEKFSHGILVKNESVFDYFDSYCRDNRIQIQACIFTGLAREEVIFVFISSHCVLCIIYIYERVKSQTSFSAYTAQKVKFSVKDFFSKCDQIRRKLRKSFTDKFIFLCSDSFLMRNSRPNMFWNCCNWNGCLT